MNVLNLMVLMSRINIETIVILAVWLVKMLKLHVKRKKVT